MENLTSSDFEVRTKKPRILFFDIETSSLVTRSWRMWQADAIRLVETFSILCWSAKWKDGAHITKCLADYKDYTQGDVNDKALVQELWQLLDQADIVVGHNLDKFDIKKFNTRAVIHGLKPFEPSKTFDTLKLARRHFAFPSNKLDALGEILGVGRKESTGGYELWEQCEKGDPKAWRKMKRYCKGDVELLIKVYDKLVSYSTNHPNVAAIQDMASGCNVCGSPHLQRRGWTPTPKGARRRIQCIDCSSWHQGEYRKAGA